MKDQEKFPHFVEEADRPVLASLCPNELVQWRVSVAYHKALPSINKKANNRKYLEQAFDMLKLAWEASRPAALAAAA